MGKYFFFFKQKTAYEVLRSLVSSEMCIRDRNHQRFLLDLDGQSLLGELARAVRDGDGRTYEAVTSLPVFILRQKGLTDDLMTASRKEWSRRIDPAAAGQAEDSDVMARLVDEALATARRAIQQHCNLPEQREIRTL